MQATATNGDSCEAMYNSLNHIGNDIIKPVEVAIRDYQELNGEMNTRMWRSLTEVGDIFNDEGETLMKEGAITQAQLDDLKKIANCFKQENLTESNSKDVLNLIAMANESFKLGKIAEVGFSFALAAMRMCPTTVAI